MKGMPQQQLKFNLLGSIAPCSMQRIDECQTMHTFGVVPTIYMPGYECASVCVCGGGGKAKETRMLTRTTKLLQFCVGPPQGHVEGAPQRQGL